MSHHAWFEHFKQQLQGLTDSFDNSGSKLSLLGYALKEQLLSSDVYLRWAMAYYKLPILQSRFFTETSLSQEMFARWATHYPWSEECLPVAEWDGSLIVACLQPPQDFPSNPSSIYVLATLENLQLAWSNLHPKKQVSSFPTIAELRIDAPAGIDLSMATATHLSAKGDSFSFEDLGMNESDSSESSDSISLEKNGEIASNPEENLEGLFNQPAVVSLESLNLKTNIPLPDADFSQEQNFINDTTEDNFDNKTLIAVDITPGSDAIIPSPEKVPESKVRTPSLEDTSPAITLENKPVSKLTSRSAGIAKPTINTASLGNFALEKIKKKNTTLLGEKIKTTLSQMKTQFEKSMILTLDDQETQAMAFAWDENFKDVKDAASSIILNSPSIFNIVSSTQKPFHGYISPNPINESFFADWNNGRVPEHVTIAPILIKEKVVGMLMGFGTKNTYNKISLNLAEKLSNEFVKGLQAA